MRMDRLLNLVTYLLNRETVSGRALADKFEVSTRTIQRDMETLSMAGIPIGSTQGINGGYFIMKSFKLNRQMLHLEVVTFKWLEESFPNAHFQDLDGQKFGMDLLVPESEKGWFHILLGYADKVIIVEPDSLRQRIVAHANAIINKYNQTTTY